MSYNEDDAWGSPHRTINTLNTTGINFRFPKVNFLWSYFLLAFKWKYCSYNLNKPCYIALNGTHMIQENIVFTLLFLSSGQFMASKINWGCEVDPLKQILGIFFFSEKGNENAFMFSDVIKQELVQSPKQWRPRLCKRAQRSCMNFW